MVGTLPGRTQGLGLITEPLLSDLGIGRVDYAQLNLWATLIGSAGAIGIGRFIDRFGSRVVLVGRRRGARRDRRADEPRDDIHRAGGGNHADEGARPKRVIGRQHRHGRSVVRSAHRHGDGHLQRGAERRVHDRVSCRRLARAVARLARCVVCRRRGEYSRDWCRSALLFVRRSPESIGASTRAIRFQFQVPVRTQNPEPRTWNRNRPGYTLREALAHACVLGLRRRRRALWTCRVGHRLVQRIDPRGERIRTERVLPDARRHGHHRPCWKFHRRLARAVRAAEPSHGRVSVGAGGRTCSRFRTSAHSRWRWDGR